MSTPRKEIYKGADDYWRWRLRAANGEVVATGESHRDERDANRAFLDALNTFTNLDEEDRAS